MAGGIPKVSKVDVDDETVYLRDGITVAFFLPMPLDSIADAVLAAFDYYLSITPPKVLRWSSIGADSEEFRPVTSKTFDKCRALLAKEPTRKRKLTSFELLDGDHDGDAPTNGFFVLGNPRDRKEPLETNLVQLYFPSDLIASQEGADSFVNKIAQIGSMLPFVYGYASPGLHWAESHEIEALTDARAIAIRYPGFDVQYNENTRSDIDSMTRGARWLTFLGPEAIKKIGGAKSIQALNTPGIEFGGVGHGVAIRAGSFPELGDRNRRLDTPLLRKIAKLLEPATLFDEPALRQTVFALDDPSFFSAWERRFLSA